MFFGHHGTRQKILQHNFCFYLCLRYLSQNTLVVITLYRLEQKSGILHGTMMCIMIERNKNITLKTVMQLARGFDMTLLEFLDDEIFRSEELEID